MLGFFILAVVVIFSAIVVNRFDRFMNFVEAKQDAIQIRASITDVIEDRIDHLEDGLRHQAVRLNEHVTINQKIFNDLLQAHGRIEELESQLEALRSATAKTNLKTKQSAQ